MFFHIFILSTHSANFRQNNFQFVFTQYQVHSIENTIKKRRHSQNDGGGNVAAVRENTNIFRHRHQSKTIDNKSPINFSSFSDQKCSQKFNIPFIIHLYFSIFPPIQWILHWRDFSPLYLFYPRQFLAIEINLNTIQLLLWLPSGAQAVLDQKEFFFSQF